MRLSPAGEAFIKRHEGFSPKLYVDSSGHTHIGHGHLVHRGPIDASNPKEFPYRLTRAPWLREIDRGEAHELFLDDAFRAERAVMRLVKVKLKQNQYDVLVSFTYNLGEGNLETSTLLRRLNARDYDAVPRELSRWIIAGGKIDNGLVRRRADDIRLWTEGKYERAAAARKGGTLSDEAEVLDPKTHARILLEGLRAEQVGGAESGLNLQQVLDALRNNQQLLQVLIQALLGAPELLEALLALLSGKPAPAPAPTPPPVQPPTPPPAVPTPVSTLETIFPEEAWHDWFKRLPGNDSDYAPGEWVAALRSGHERLPEGAMLHVIAGIADPAGGKLWKPFLQSDRKPFEIEHHFEASDGRTWMFTSATPRETQPVPGLGQLQFGPPTWDPNAKRPPVWGASQGWAFMLRLDPKLFTTGPGKLRYQARAAGRADSPWSEIIVVRG